jgi:hypothetical protein
MVASSLERADEIGFKLSLDFVVPLLMLSRELLIRDRILPCHLVDHQ